MKCVRGVVEKATLRRDGVWRQGENLVNLSSLLTGAHCQQPCSGAILGHPIGVAHMAARMVSEGDTNVLMPTCRCAGREPIDRPAAGHRARPEPFIAILRSTRHRSPIVLTLAMLLAACGAAPPRVPTAAQVEAGPHVEVSVDPALDAERTRAFEEHDGTTQLRNAILDELAGTGKADSLHGAALRVVVTRFRLRSTGSGVWLGAMAGADMLDVSVTLERDGATQRTFKTGAGTIVAGLVKPSASGRFNGLLREVAKRVVAQL